jgi:hypothetical protein
MSDPESVDARPLAERFVLLGVTELALRDETPAHSVQVMRTCERHLDALGGEVIGGVSEADVVRAMNVLESDGLLARHDVGEQSATGKGRPSYALSVEPTAVLDALNDDERLADLLDRTSLDGTA